MGDRFTVVLRKDRLYGMTKATPLDQSGGLAAQDGASAASTLSSKGGDGAANMVNVFSCPGKRWPIHRPRGKALANSWPLCPRAFSKPAVFLLLLFKH
jgi:hypothetical protein